MHEASYVQLQYLFLNGSFGTTARLLSIEMLMFLSFKNVYTRPVFGINESKCSPQEDVLWFLQDIFYNTLDVTGQTPSVCFKDPIWTRKQHPVLDRHWGIKEKKRKYNIDWCYLPFFTPAVKPLWEVVAWLFLLCNSWTENSWSIQGIFSNQKKTRWA